MSVRPKSRPKNALMRLAPAMYRREKLWMIPLKNVVTTAMRRVRPSTCRSAPCAHSGSGLHTRTPRLSAKRTHVRRVSRTGMREEGKVCRRTGRGVVETVRARDAPVCNLI